MALEMTTGEVMQQLQKFKLNNIRTVQIEQFLSNADLVKFAKYQPDLKENENVISIAREIVDQTKPDEIIEALKTKQAETEEQVNG